MRILPLSLVLALSFRVDTSEGGVRGRNVRRASCVSGRSFGGHVEGVLVMVAMRAVLVVVVVQILVVVV